MEKDKVVKTFIQIKKYGPMAAVMVFVIAGYCMCSMNLVLTGIMFLFLNNILFVAEDWKNRFVFGLFHITFFTFLLGRPFIGLCKGDDWWNALNQLPKNVWFALTLVLVSLTFLFVGAFLTERILSCQKKEKTSGQNSESEFTICLRVVALCVFCVTMFFYLLKEIEPLLAIQSGEYLEYYTSFESKLPGIVHTIASFMKYSLCVFLATLPSKRRAFIPLALFEISAIPSLLVGIRNPIMLNSLFILTYYLLRDALEGNKTKKWFGKTERVLVGIATPLCLIFMGVYSSIREGKGISMKNPFALLADFFYGQGATFDALSVAYGYREGIKLLRPKNYTFGGFIDYILHGRIGQMLWHTEALPSGNNEINGIYSNSFAHNFSYVSLKEEYLKGRGRGSSYMLENYFDFGWIGVILFSLVLGILLIAVIHWFGKKLLANTVILISLTTIFFTPRAEATGWLTFILTVQFWLCMVACYLGAYICTKSKICRNILRCVKLYP